MLALDKDDEAVADARRRFGADPRFAIEHAGFEELEAVARAHFGDRRLHGVLLDLGVSSPQLDDAERGFGFSQDGPLDMRMNRANGVTAAEWVATTTEREIARVLRRYGEEPKARRIAAAVVRERARRPIETTRALAELVLAVVPRAGARSHPATRTFQAIRIAINGELEALEQALPQCVSVLAAHGRLVVISFHSLEDRLVKRFIARESRGDPVYAGLPDMPSEARPRLKPVGRLVRPTDVEVERNPRARSARLRIAERLEETGA